MMRKAPLILSTVLLTIACAVASTDQWTAVNAGLPTASFGISLMAIDPAAPSTLYAVTNQGALYRSADSAASWHPVRGLSSVTFVALDPQNSGTIYAAASYSLWKSSDAGVTWVPVQTSFNLPIGQVAVDPFNSSTLYAGALDAGFPLFKSSDGGASWNQLTNLPLSNSPIADLVFDSSASSTLYVTREGGDILETTDGGESWRVLMGRNGALFSFAPLLVDPRSPSTLYAGSFAAFQGLVTPVPFDDGLGSISKSTDGGATWSVIRTGIPTGTTVISLAMDAGGVLYATYSSASGAGIVKSLDAGQSWSVTDAISKSGSYSVLAASQSLIYAGYSNSDSNAGGILKSADGTNWLAANAGLDFIDIRTLKPDLTHPGVVYAGGAGGVFKSVDSAATWSALGSPQAGVVRSLLIDPGNPRNLYTDSVFLNQCSYTDQLVFKSVDGGANWSSISPLDSGCLVSILGGSSAGVMVIDPVNPNVLFIQETDSDDGVFTLLKSADSGATWSATWQWPDLTAGVNALLIDPDNTATIYAGLDGVYGGAAGVYQSLDGGASWRSVGLGQTAITALAMDPADSNIVYAAGTSGVFRTDNAGADWTPLSSSPPGVITALLMPAGRSAVLYAATSGNGVYRSSDGGASWISINDGLANLDVRALVLAPGGNDIFVATSSGVFQLTVHNLPLRR